MRWAGRLDHDDDEEKTHPGAGGPEAHPGRSAAGRRQGRRGRLPRAGRLGADVLPVAEPVRRVEGRRRQEAEGPGAGENSTLKRLLADAELEKAALKEIASGNF